MGSFWTVVTLLKVHRNSQAMKRESFQEGTYGKIYLLGLNGKEYAVKSQPIKQKDKATLNRKIDQVLRELFLYKIASALEIGPFMRCPFGFDIVCYNDAI